MPPETPESPITPDVTVVLPVRNEGPYLAAVLGDLLDQDFPPDRMEILVVDGESTDDTRAVAEAIATRDSRIRVLANPLRRSSPARAIGAHAARGAYVLYVDGHCRVPSRTLIRDMVELFERTKADCLARPQPLIPSVPDRTARAVAAARTSPFGHSGRSTIYDHTERPASPVSAGAMYRRDVFARAGNFDPEFDACEDVEFNYRVERAGCSCWTSPRLAVHYEPRRTLGGLFRQMFRYGIGRRRLHRKHPEAFTVETLIPIGFVLGLPLVTAPLWAPSPWGWILAAPYFLYVAACVAASIHAAAKAGWDLLPFLPPAFIATHAGLGAGYVAGLVAGSRP